MNLRGWLEESEPRWRGFGKGEAAMGTCGGWFAMAACHMPGLRLGVSGGRAGWVMGKDLRKLADRSVDLIRHQR